MGRRERERGRSRASTPEPVIPAGDPHAAMLASQVEEALRLGLATLDDPRLEDATLVAVVQDGGVLRATVECDRASVTAVEAALARAEPRLRAEVASEIHRKRMPLVRYRVVPRLELP